jgi:hypothetical protein
MNLLLTSWNLGLTSGRTCEPNGWSSPELQLAPALAGHRLHSERERERQHHGSEEQPSLRQIRDFPDQVKTFEMIDTGLKTFQTVPGTSYAIDAIKTEFLVKKKTLIKLCFWQLL